MAYISIIIPLYTYIYIYIYKYFISSTFYYIYIKFLIIGLLWFEHNYFPTQMRRLTSPALIRRATVVPTYRRHTVMTAQPGSLRPRLRYIKTSSSSSA